MELDLNALQQLPETEAQATNGNPLDPDCTFTCTITCNVTCDVSCGHTTT
jgi:hypothetical protein